MVLACTVLEIKGCLVIRGTISQSRAVDDLTKPSSGMRMALLWFETYFANLCTAGSLAEMTLFKSSATDSDGHGWTLLQPRASCGLRLLGKTVCSVVLASPKAKHQDRPADHLCMHQLFCAEQNQLIRADNIN